MEVSRQPHAQRIEPSVPIEYGLGKPQSRFGSFGEEINLFLLPEIKPRTLRLLLYSLQCLCCPDTRNGKLLHKFLILKSKVKSHFEGPEIDFMLLDKYMLNKCSVVLMTGSLGKNRV